MLRCDNDLEGIGETEPKYLYLRIEHCLSKADIEAIRGDIEVVKEIVMRAWSPIYEGDGIIHCGASAALPEVAQPAPAVPSLWEAAGRAIAGFFSWLEKGAERARYRELENYLAESGDVFDLERRIRRVERSHRGMFDPYS